MNKNLLAVTEDTETKQLKLNFGSLDNKTSIYECVVFVTTLQEEVVTITTTYLYGGFAGGNILF